jgi:hypothetical protein
VSAAWTSRSGRGVSLLGLGLAVLFLAGCGLSEYRKKMENAQRRVTELDEGEPFLGPPLRPPEKKEGVKDLPDFWLRPPRGIAADPQTTLPGPVLHYVRQDPACPFTELLVAVAPAGQKDFFTTLPLPPVEPSARRTIVQPSPEGEERTLDLYDNPKRGFALCMEVRQGVQVALGFQTEPGRAPATAARQIEASAKSLGVGEEAGKLREEWGRRQELKERFGWP